MAWAKTPPEIVAAFEKAAPKDPRVVRRQMFGYPALFLNGNMVAGTFQDKVIVRLAEADRERAMKTAGAKQFAPMPGRPMTGFFVLPAEVIAKPAALAKWIERARVHAATLPAKTKAPKKAVTSQRRSASPRP